ncbi:pentapeptide repeat-containing protein [Streptomyces chilikensis]|uniref:Pentapeptide repeat-containing protein n=1 Tax=Streptomyces chilikensis TaxID=1194079 RepID=A0ABV3EJF2_9ACTN
MRLIRFLRQREGRGLPLWRIGVVLPLAFLAALSTAAVVFYAGWELLAVTEVKAEGVIDSKTLFDLVKLAFGAVAGFGALVALVVAYRKQRVDEAGALREATRLHTERFSTAVAQLGDPSTAVRLGGVHALAGLADDAPTRRLRQTCIDVLCAYLRLPHVHPDSFVHDSVEWVNATGFLEVRNSVLRIIQARLSLDADQEVSWRGHHFDFTGARFDGGDLSCCDFTGTALNFQGCTFDRPFSFAMTRFGGGCQALFTGCVVRDSGALSFSDAKFDASIVDFEGAQIDAGTVDFDSADFKDALIGFRRARLVGLTSFRNATVDSGVISFEEARCDGPFDFTGLDMLVSWEADHEGFNFEGAFGAAPHTVVSELTASNLCLPPEWVAVAEDD